MPKTFTGGICAAAVASPFAVTAPRADNHVITNSEGGYLPEVVYVGRGDNLILGNNSDVAHTLNGPDESWTSGPTAADGRYVLDINNRIALTFSGDGADGEVIHGSFTYGEAPLGA